MHNLSYQAKPVKLIIEKTPFDIRIKEQGFFKSTGVFKPDQAGNKQEIKEFSLRAQKNARLKFRSAAQGMVTVFCLTYPIEMRGDLDGREIKRHFDTFMKAFKRQYGKDTRYVWVLEFQKNGNPHYHVMTDYCPGDIEEMDAWCRQKWFDIVDSCLEKHFHNGLRSLEFIRTNQGCADYMAAYLNKHEQKQVPSHFQGVGRFWGGSRNAWLIETEEIEFEDTFLGTTQARAMVRTFRKYRSAKLRQVAKVTGKKYRHKRTGGGFISWSGRSAWDKIMEFEQGVFNPSSNQKQPFQGLPG